MEKHRIYSYPVLSYNRIISVRIVLYLPERKISGRFKDKTAEFMLLYSQAYH